MAGVLTFHNARRYSCIEERRRRSRGFGIGPENSQYSRNLGDRLDLRSALLAGCQMPAAGRRCLAGEIIFEFVHHRVVHIFTQLLRAPVRAAETLLPASGGRETA